MTESPIECQLELELSEMRSNENKAFKPHLLYESDETALLLSGAPGYEDKLRLRDALKKETDIYREIELIREFLVNHSIVSLPEGIYNELDKYYDSKEHKKETFRLVSAKEKWLAAVSQVLRYLENKSGKHKKFIGDLRVTYFPTNLGDKGKDDVSGVKFPSNSDNYGRGGSAILKVLVELGYLERIGNYCNSGGNIELGTSGAYSIPYRFTQKYYADYYTYPKRISSNNKFYIKQFDSKVSSLKYRVDLLHEFVNQFHFDFELDVVIAAKQLLIDGISHKDNVEFVDGKLSGLVLNKITAKFISDLYDLDLLSLLKVGEDDYSGRFHTKFNQIKKEARKFMKVDGEEVVEIDIKSCQLSLLISESIRIGNLKISEGLDLTKIDLYDYLGLNINKFKGKSRDQIKSEVMKSLFSLSPNDKTQSWVAQLHKGIFDTLVAIKDINRDYYNKGKHSSLLPRYLQCMEVEVISRVRTELNSRNIRYVSIFDSLVIPKKYTKEVLEICHTVRPDFSSVAGLPTVSKRHYEVIKWMPES